MAIEAKVGGVEEVVRPGKDIKQKMFDTYRLLWCYDCNIWLPAGVFYHQTQTPNNVGHRYYCKQCETNRRDKKANRRRYRLKYLKFKNTAIEALGGQCQRCGYTEFHTALEFHHVYPEIKAGSITQLALNSGLDSEEFRQELDKCVLLCSNCHRALETGEWLGDFIKSEFIGYRLAGDSTAVGVVETAIVDNKTVIKFELN